MSRCWSNLNKDSQVSMEGGGGSFAKFYLQFWQQLFMSRCWSNLNKDSQVSMEGGGEALQSSTYSFGSSCSWAGVEVILIRTHRSVWKVGGGSFAKFYLQFWQQLFMSRCWSNLNKDSQVSMEGGGEALQSSTYSFGSSCSWAGVEVILIRTHRSVWKVGGKLCKVLLTVLAAVVHEQVLK